MDHHSFSPLNKYLFYTLMGILGYWRVLSRLEDNKCADRKKLLLSQDFTEEITFQLGQGYEFNEWRRGMVFQTNFSHSNVPLSLCSMLIEVYVCVGEWGSLWQDMKLEGPAGIMR